MIAKNHRFQADRLLAGLISLLSVAGLLPSAMSTAKAAPLPVIAVNREIGLSVTGNFEDLASNFGGRSTTTVNNNASEGYQSIDSGHSHQTGWTPGFQADVQYMFDTDVLKHLYVATSFTLDDGNVDDIDNFHSVTTSPSRPPNALSMRDHGSVNRSRINVTGEIGKGFLLLDDRLLITPTVQGGYSAGGTDTLTGYGKGYVGLALHIDYAITSRLVIRGRAGWAQFLDTHGYFWGSAGPHTKDSRPEWSGDIGLDYRMTDRIHMTGGVRYTYLNYGRAKFGYSDQNDYWSESYSSSAITWRNRVQLRLGVAYQL